MSASSLRVTGYLDLETLDALDVTGGTPSLGALPRTTPAAQPGDLAPPVAANPIASEAAPPMDPVWIDQPTAADLDRLRPRGAPRLVEGRATVRCLVLEDGTLTQCQATSENPPGSRFGQAGVRASALYRMLVDGEHATFVGREIEVTVRWPPR